MRPHRVLGGLAHLVAGPALRENLLARSGVLGMRLSEASEQEGGGENQETPEKLLFWTNVPP